MIVLIIVVEISFVASRRLSDTSASTYNYKSTTIDVWSLDSSHVSFVLLQSTNICLNEKHQQFSPNMIIHCR